MSFKYNELFPEITQWKIGIEDNRGYSYRVLNKTILEYLSIPTEYKDSFYSCSFANVVRGMHYGTQGLGRLIHVIRGQVMDVFVDLRKNSPTFGKWSYTLLSDRNVIWIPEYFAHGFLALKQTYMVYHYTKPYSEDTHRILAYNDPDVGIGWMGSEPFNVSDRDQNGKLLKDLDFYF